MKKPKPQGPTKQSWIVTIKAVVEREIITEDCTEEEAREHPYEFAMDERDLQNIDWDVISVEPNL